ncbi:hypothetical protein [Labilibaculum sp.]|uniref:hypothetical protein n=1 Tax=Labilibaculum sp. TaxID=2060723 RepID=UPI002AA78027|nr:hypothetical protein [Labilibaculum sp.]MBN2598523.1 hypothetical protein [Marinifilaceae bacterium]
MSAIYRELTKIKELIEELGFTISYPYDDLLFVDSNAILIQFNDLKKDSFFAFFNESMNDAVTTDLEEKMKGLALIKKLEIKSKGRFQMKQKEGSQEELELEFIS